ncbi:DUF881 domain-containing protein [Arachnia propionica]|uniref:DUF881 domain-containing protein n=1 Tax=Arachnia propionica TaxID=1750 RepID=A0A3P1X207_9ACTN|nr:DUF881 domain-containing protein [Arachnia propionica]RRD50773.1 DUF881 domain-containing protein [Arachnia propionica]
MSDRRPEGARARLAHILRRRQQATPGNPRGRAATVVVCVLAGLMISVAAVAARGTDLRTDRNLSLRELVATQAERNEDLSREVATVRTEVDELTKALNASPEDDTRLAEVALDAGSEPVSGPGVRVILTDAPVDVKPAGVDDDSLVVHQQDIQAVVNALWAGGAEAISIQGQRVIATTGIKCVGNSVVLHGIPYAPPYVIEAIGDAKDLTRSLDEAPAIRIYRQYVEAYGLGYEQAEVAALDLPAFEGAVGISHAKRG